MSERTARAREPELAALVVGPDLAYAALPDGSRTWPVSRLPERFAELDATRSPRWVVWSAAAALRRLVDAGVAISRTWDLAEAHRLAHGGWPASASHVWAGCHGLPESSVPSLRQRRAGFAADLLDIASGDDGLFTPDGHLRPDALTAWADRPERLAQLARAALACPGRQSRALREQVPVSGERMRRTVWSESAAAVLCLELERDGLPFDRPTAEQLVRASAGPRPADAADAAAIRAERDHVVLRQVPGHERTDLRNPGQVRELLAAVGVDVPNTRAWVLEPYRATHPLVAALLTWRKDERIATTYGYRWLDDHVGADDRLRGAWSACDGAAGRMTAQNGLHNLPTPLRPAVCAAPGHLFVRADLGQIEPRVLAVVSVDRAFAAATRSDDLYAPVAATLGTERAVAKVAVLAAMYGQRSGAAGRALAGLERAYPVAMRLLDRAYADGVARRPVRTWGGRLIRFDAPPPGMAGGEPSPTEGDAPGPAEPDAGRDAARGRYARNAIIQGSAAELFKAWAATVRSELAGLGGQIVLCLHDELLVHVPERFAEQGAAVVGQCLQRAARTWAGTDQVRFVADVRVIRRWSEAKD